MATQSMRHWRGRIPTPALIADDRAAVQNETRSPLLLVILRFEVQIRRPDQEQYVDPQKDTVDPGHVELLGATGPFVRAR